MKRLSFSFTLCVLLTGAAFVVSRSAETATPAPSSHSVIGIVREISPDRRKALIRHEAIPNYMAAMTMEFNVRNTNELEGIQVGDTIRFRLIVEDDTHWIDNVRKSASASKQPSLGVKSPSASRVVELRPGDILPDFEFLAESGKSRHISDFRGRALVFTFFFTRCPLPDFCPRMNQNFAKARELIISMTNTPNNWQFLSISFDPEIDKPAVLRGYANAFRTGTSSNWMFATASRATLAEIGPRLDLMVNRDPAGGISHNLRTVVLDPAGRIHRQFDGNQWTPNELADTVIEAARQSK